MGVDFEYVNGWVKATYQVSNMLYVNISIRTTNNYIIDMFDNSNNLRDLKVLFMACNNIFKPSRCRLYF